MSQERLYTIREEMEKAAARRLQPYFIRTFFMKAFDTLGGSLYPRERGRYEVTHVPEAIRNRDRRITGRNRRMQEPVLKRYDRVCFDKDSIDVLDRPGLSQAVLLHPGHPLLLAVSDLLLEKHANLLRQGTILVDPTDEGTEPWLMFLLAHEVQSGSGRVLSKRLNFVRVAPDGSASFAGWAPHLDLNPLDEEDRPKLAEVLGADWIRADLEQRAVALAASTLVPQHYKEVSERTIAHVDKTLAAIHERLTKEISFWSDRWIKLKEDSEAGKDVRLNLTNARRTITDLEGRLENRKKELQAMRHVVNGTPIALGGALVVPAGLLWSLGGGGSAAPPPPPPPSPPPEPPEVDPLTRARTEELAMQAVRQSEEARGWRVSDVSADKCGWDMTSYPPANVKAEVKHIEVKGRQKGATTIHVTRNEILYALNQAEKFWLAIVIVAEDESVEGPYYLQNPFDSEPGWGVSSVVYEIKALLDKARRG